MASSKSTLPLHSHPGFAAYNFFFCTLRALDGEDHGAVLDDRSLLGADILIK